MTINLVLPMHLESFYELYKRGTLQLDKNKCIKIQKYDENGYPEVDPVDFTNRFPYCETEEQVLILECEVDKKNFEAVRFRIEGIASGESITLNHISTEKDIQWLHVEDIKRVFPLSHNAAVILPSKIGEEICIEKPVFQALVENAFDIQEKAFQNKGISALFQIIGLDISFDRETLDTLFEQAANLKLSYNNPKKNDRFLLHALVYERREPFPKSDIGLLFDLCKILAEREQAPDFRKTKFYEKIDAIKSEWENADIVSVIRYFENDPDYGAVRKLTSSGNPQQKDYVTAILFTKYKESLRNDSYNPLEMVFEIQAIFDLFPAETRSALYLLGKFFSYERFYNALYTAKKLRFLKNNSNIAESDFMKPREDINACPPSPVEPEDNVNSFFTKQSQEDLPFLPLAEHHGRDSDIANEPCDDDNKAFKQSAVFNEEEEKAPIEIKSRKEKTTSVNEDSKTANKKQKKTRKSRPPKQ